MPTSTYPAQNADTCIAAIVYLEPNSDGLVTITGECRNAVSQLLERVTPEIRHCVAKNFPEIDSGTPVHGIVEPERTKFKKKLLLALLEEVRQAENAATQDTRHTLVAVLELSRGPQMQALTKDPHPFVLG